MSIMLAVTYAECHIKFRYAECRYAECHYAECRGPVWMTPNNIGVLVIF
jgi:hypothetical protein